MDLQTILNNAMVARRSEEMKTSTKLTLGEIIIKMETIKNKELPVVFDVKKYFPVSIDSWRGSYCELAFNYEHEGKKLSVKEWLKELNNTIGKTLTGYKGGDYLMGNTTPVWVANYGTSSGFKEDSTAVIDILEKKNKVVIKTKDMDY